VRALNSIRKIRLKSPDCDQSRRDQPTNPRCFSKMMQKPSFRRVKHCILWFRNDLRIHDNAIFHHPSVKAAERVTPVYIFDPRHFKDTDFGSSRKTGGFRAQFIRESVNDLRSSLKSLGSDLSMFVDKPEDVLQKLAGPQSIVICQEEVTSEELNVDKAVSKGLHKVDSKLVKVWGPTLYHPDDLPFSMDNLPEPFTVMRNTLEKRAKVEVRELLPDPKLPAANQADGSLKDVPSLEALGFSKEEISEMQTQDEDKRGVMKFTGGETKAMERVAHFTKTSLKTYKKTRNGLIGESYSSKYSPWLACGCLSPRMIYWKVSKDSYDADIYVKLNSKCYCYQSIQTAHPFKKNQKTQHVYG